MFFFILPSRATPTVYIIITRGEAVLCNREKQRTRRISPQRWSSMLSPTQMLVERRENDGLSEGKMPEDDQGRDGRRGLLAGPPPPPPLPLSLMADRAWTAAFALNVRTTLLSASLYGVRPPNAINCSFWHKQYRFEI